MAAGRLLGRWAGALRAAAAGAAGTARGLAAGARGAVAGRPPARAGALAVKCGMMGEWCAESGARVPLTVLWVDSCRVTQVKTEAREGYSAVQVGAGARRAHPRRLPGSLAGHFRAAGVTPKRALAEFRVGPDAVLPAGTEIRASHFVPGQLVDVSGTTRGKGFAGGMKRWGFAGGNASHGASKSHRTLGSTGGCQDPGRVWPGKKMPGRMGGKRRTTFSARVWRVCDERGLIWVKGQVPGGEGGFVEIRDAVRPRRTFRQPPLPFPTVPAEEAEAAA